MSALPAVRGALCLNARKDCVELVFANLESIVLDRHAIAAERVRAFIAMGEIQGQRVVDSHPREITNRALMERKSEDSCEKFCRRDLVAPGYSCDSA